ncbi:hypothetical protein [Ruegeria sp. HKCCD8929]|uniref:hypothetical protein n=1 Tax=Ruegeria sp. HKCCD8929 TaxID=2683006 RepID=UPI001487AE5D|nr:hypothetical protein [Ruegeria sp. HKCCD8929]
MTRLKQNWKGLAAYAAVMLVLTGFLLLLVDALAGANGHPAVRQALAITVCVWFAVLVLGLCAVTAEGGIPGWSRRNWGVPVYLVVIFALAWAGVMLPAAGLAGAGGLYLIVKGFKLGVIRFGQQELGPHYSVDPSHPLYPHR